MAARPLATSLTYAVASPSERRCAAVLVLGLLGVSLSTLPLARLPLALPDAVLPAVTSASIVAMFVSAALLRTMYRTTRYAPLAILAYAYSISAALSLPAMLSMPHVFSPNGFGLGPQAAPWFWVLAHAFFVLLLGGYVWSDSYVARRAVLAEASVRLARVYGACAVATAAASVALVVVFHARLPVLVRDGAYTAGYHLLVEQLLLASACVVLVTLVARTSLRSTTHLWLAAVLAVFAIEIYLNSEAVNARASVAWYVGFLEAAVWQTLFLCAQMRDASARFAAIAADTLALHEEAHRDALTGTFNRRGYEQRYDAALAASAAAHAPLALLAVDIDHFKKYNDHFGHLVGDEALRAVAGAMVEVVNRPADAVCRIGGDEFIIILAATGERGAAAVAERVRAGISRLRIRNAPDVPLATLSISIGIAVASAALPETAAALFERADKALYRAKGVGRNRVVGSGEGRGEANLRAV